MWKRLCLSLVLLGLWAALRGAYPAQWRRLEAAYTRLSAPTCDLWQACGEMGAGLGRGEPAVDCLGQFARRVFFSGEDA